VFLIYTDAMITLALVGVAHIHTPGFIGAIKSRNNFKVKSVWDPAPAKAAVRAAELGATAVTDVASIYADPGIDAVVICSETNRHEELVLPAAAARKNLFVEKPLGFKPADALKMADAIDMAGVIFQTGYFRRGEGVHQFLKDQIAAGAFGKITRVRASNCHSGALGGWFDSKPADPANDWRWMANPKISGCGAFGDLGTHMLDILIWLFGDVQRVTAQLGSGTARYPDCDELGEAVFVFKSGVIGTLAAAWTDIIDPISLMISGTEGYAYVLNGSLHFKSRHVSGADGKQPWAHLPEKEPAGFDAFLDALEGKKPATLVTAREAAYRSAVMGAMYEASGSNQWVDVS
jgi:predicted dehydrogenase